MTVLEEKAQSVRRRIFDFKTNKYPLGIIMANARRIGKKIK